MVIPEFCRSYFGFGFGWENNPGGVAKISWWNRGGVGQPEQPWWGMLTFAVVVPLKATIIILLRRVAGRFNHTFLA